MEETQQLKKCTKCKNDYPCDADHFYRDKKNKDGLNVWCKACMNNYLSVRHRKGKGEIKEDLKILRKFSCDARLNRDGVDKVVYPAREPRNPPNKVEEKSQSITKGHALGFYRNCFLNIYENLIALGIQDHIIQRMFGVSQSGYDAYTKLDKAAEEAYQDGMSKLQGSLCQAILAKAFGYNYDEEKIIYVRIEKDGASEWKEFKKEVHKKHFPGWAELIEFFMCNKFPDLWKKSTEVIKKDATYDSDPGQRDRKKIESLARNILEGNPVEPAGEHQVQG